MLPLLAFYVNSGDQTWVTRFEKLEHLAAEPSPCPHNAFLCVMLILHATHFLVVFIKFNRFFFNLEVLKICIIRLSAKRLFIPF